MPKAELIFHSRREYADGGILEIKLWEVPTPVHGSEHLFKYSLFYGKDGERLVCYDNERGKGDHKHVGGREEPYGFQGVDALIAHFEADVAKVRGSL